MPDVVLTPPAPAYDRAFQPGVTDPVWPENPAAGVDPAVYHARYAGQLERQRHLHVVTADVVARSRGELARALRGLAEFARRQMSKAPPDAYQRGYDPVVTSRRVTVTVGFGATLFTTPQGDDRYGLAARKPTWLKIMPRTEGDDPAFAPRRTASDLVVLIASDDVYVNEYITGLLLYRTRVPAVVVRQVERGYARPDTREPSGFEDGLTNPRDLSPDRAMRRLVYVQDGDAEPDWCVDGTYLAYRKVRRRLAGFFRLSPAGRTDVFGVDAQTGQRLTRADAHAHSSKMNPRRATRDMFGLTDEARRILRRPYFYNDGVDAAGEELRGLHHLSFARDLGVQYEWPVHMWQMNENFPTPGAGRDALYESGGAANVGGGYYFVPAAPANANEPLAAALLE